MRRPHSSTAAPRRLYARVRRRIRSEWCNAARSLGLIGWRRSTGPPINAGAVVRNGLSEEPSSGADAAGEHESAPVQTGLRRDPLASGEIGRLGPACDVDADGHS